MKFAQPIFFPSQFQQNLLYYETHLNSSKCCTIQRFYPLSQHLIELIIRYDFIQ